MKQKRLKPKQDESPRKALRSKAPRLEEVQIKREPAESPRSVHSAASLASLCHSAASLEDLGDDEITPENIIKNVRVTGTEAPVEVDESLDWKCVGGLTSQIRQLKEVAILPLLYPQLVTQLGIQPIRGVLLHGPPGTGKTHTVRCLTGALKKANVNVSLFVRKGGDILSKWVGEGERQLRDLFDEAQRAQPAVIFLDEVDGLAPLRSARSEQCYSSIVATLLSLMDGVQARGQVLVIGATNRPDSVDEALRRPGRFDREIYFGVPEAAERQEILSVHTRQWPQPLPPGVVERWAAKHLAGCTGADIAAICNEAGLAAVRRSLPQIYDEDDVVVRQSAFSAVRITERDLEAALRLVKPTLARGSTARFFHREVPAQWRELLATPIAEMVEKIEGSVGCHERFDFALDSPQHPVTKFVAPAALRQVSLPVFTLDWLAACASGEPLLTFMHRQVQAAIAQAPSVVYVPNIDTYRSSDPDYPNMDPELILDLIPPEFSVCVLATWCRESPDGAHKVSLPGKVDLEKFWFCVLENLFRRILDDVWEEVSEETERKRRDQTVSPPKSGCEGDAEEALKENCPPTDENAPPSAPSASEWGLNDFEREEDYYFRLLRFQIGECLEGLLGHADFKPLRRTELKRLVDKPEYRQLVKEPLCLDDVHIKNTNGEYTDVTAVQKDLDLIRDNAYAYSNNPELEDEARKKIRWMSDSFANTYKMKLYMIDKAVVQGCAQMVARRAARAARRRAAPREKPAAAAVSAEARNDELPPELADMLCTTGSAVAAHFNARSKNLVLNLDSHSKKIDRAVDSAVSRTKMPRMVKYVKALFAAQKEHFGVGDAKDEFGAQLKAACQELCDEVGKVPKT